MIILTLFNQNFDPSSQSHLALLHSLKHLMVNFIGIKTMKTLRFRIQDGQKEEFEKDILEALGFQNGFRPELDLTHGGVLGILIFMSLLEQFKKIYHDARPEMTVLQELHANMFDKQEIVMLNIMQISQESSKANSDGFPVVPLMINIVHRSIELIKPIVNQARNKRHREHIKKIKKNQFIFEAVCSGLMNGNVY